MIWQLVKDSNKIWNPFSFNFVINENFVQWPPGNSLPHPDDGQPGEHPRGLGQHREEEVHWCSLLAGDVSKLVGFERHLK